MWDTSALATEALSSHEQLDSTREPFRAGCRFIAFLDQRQGRKTMRWVNIRLVRFKIIGAVLLDKDHRRSVFADIVQGKCLFETGSDFHPLLLAQLG